MAHRERAFTGNAADPKAVQRAAALSKRRRERFQEDLCLALQHPPTRAVLWALIGRAGVYESVFHRDSHVMASLAGQQTFGQTLLADILDADEQAYLLMEQEARGRDRRDRETEDAVLTPRAEREDGQDS